jgi:hypothetical protein
MECSDHPEQTRCIVDKMQGTVPTAAQTQAKDAYCQECGAANATDCTNFFSINPSGNNGAGYSLLLSSDQTATRAVTVCSSKCAPFDYGLCVAFILCAESGGDFCVDSGFCAPQ